MRNPFRYVLFKTIFQMSKILLPAQRKKALVTVVLILCNAFFDVFSLASILPFILLALDSSRIRSNQYLNFVYEALGFQSANAFLAAAILFILLLFVCKNAVGFLINRHQSRFTYAVATSLSERLFVEYYKKGYLFFSNTNSSLSARNITHIPVEFSTYILLATVTFLSDFIVFVLVIAGIAIYNFQIFALLLLIAGPPFFLLYRGKKNKLSEIGSRTKKLHPAATKHLFHGINGYVEVKLHHKESWFIKNFIDLQNELNQNLARFHAINLLPARLAEIIVVLSVAIIFVYTAFFSENPGELFVLLSLFTASAYRLMPSLNRISIALMNIKTFQYTMDILQELDGKPAARHFQDSGPPENIRFNEYIAFRNLSFSYSNAAPLILRNVSFTVKKGDTVGFIGKSGSGKTTLMNILLRFLTERSGQIVVDGRPLAPEDTAAWRKLIGYVKQNPFLLDGSVADNIAFGEDRVEMSLERLQLAIQQAGLAEFVSGLPDGIETQIGEHGAKLSGGQRQRLAIARALYRNSQILVFDEATSELDSQTEKEIANAIERLAGRDKTIFIIAHRITTLRNCDRIYELEDGEITGVYQYPDLLAKTLEPI
ncbi:ABC transporter ATP-binding protein/permease [candidate division KSB1 bacterium]|nr:ABC transporter ATP-binding protein/permease [candidate division KSB1 bacterium]